MLAFKLIMASLSMQLYVYLYKKTVVYRAPVNKQNYSKESWCSLLTGFFTLWKFGNVWYKNLFRDSIRSFRTVGVTWATLVKWFSVLYRNKWLWIRILLWSQEICVKFVQSIYIKAAKKNKDAGTIWKICLKLSKKY